MVISNITNNPAETQKRYKAGNIKSTRTSKQGNVFVCHVPPTEALTLQTLQTLAPIQRRRMNPLHLFCLKDAAELRQLLSRDGKIKAGVVICNHEGVAAVAR